MKRDLSVDVTNCYRDVKKDEVIALLKAGKVVSLYVDCIGHTRAEMVEAQYVNEMKKEVDLKIGKDEWGDNCYYI